MDSIRIIGGNRLEGQIPISGAKNSALTLLPCALLTSEKVTLTNLPRLADVDNFSHLLNELGASTKVAAVKKGEIGRRMTIEASWVHLSHAQLFAKQNPGLDTVGVRLNYKL